MQELHFNSIRQTVHDERSTHMMHVADKRHSIVEAYVGKRTQWKVNEQKQMTKRKTEQITNAHKLLYCECVCFGYAMRRLKANSNNACKIITVIISGCTKAVMPFN